MSDTPAALGAVIAEISQNGGSRTLGERAYEAIHEAIITGLLAPGDRLPIEEVARGLGMSPMPVREALGRLHDGGLVDLIPHRGATVTALSVDDLREIYVSRLALEPVAIAGAARRFDDDDADRARRALARHAHAYEHGTPVETFSAHTAFHFALYEAARNPWLTRLIGPLWESSQRYRLSLPPQYRRRLRERLAEHERILAACIAHEPERAATELRNHLVNTANRVGARMGQEPLFDEIGESEVARLPELKPPLSIRAARPGIRTHVKGSR